MLIQARMNDTSQYVHIFQRLIQLDVSVLLSHDLLAGLISGISVSGFETALKVAKLISRREVVFPE